MTWSHTASSGAPHSRLSPLEEKDSPESNEGGLLALRALETDWKHGTTPRREGASFLVIKLSGQIQKCMWHRQKAVTTRDLAFFHMQPFCWQQDRFGRETVCCF